MFPFDNKKRKGDFVATNKEEFQHVRVNINITNNKREPYLVNYDKALTNEIDVDEDFEFSVERLVTAENRLPFFFWNPDVDSFLVGCKTAPNTYLNVEVPIVSNSIVYKGVTYRCVWDYQQFLIQVNTAFATLFTNAAIADAPPVFMYNESLKMIEVYIPAVIVDFPDIYINGQLGRFLQGFEFDAGPTTGTFTPVVPLDNDQTRCALKFRFYDPLNLYVQARDNSIATGKRRFRQYASFIGNWNDIMTFVVKTSMVALGEEYIEASNVINGDTSNMVGTTMATDFAYSYQEGTAQGPNGQQYYAPEIPRKIDILAGPMKRIHIMLYVRLRDNTEIPYIMPIDGSIIIKCLFRKK